MPDPDCPPGLVRSRHTDPEHGPIYWGRVIDVPTTWLWRQGRGWTDWRPMDSPLSSHCVVECVLPSPATEWVPLAHIIGRTLPGQTRPVSNLVVEMSDSKNWVWRAGYSWPPLTVRDDGCVEVLVEP